MVSKTLAIFALATVVAVVMGQSCNDCNGFCQCLMDVRNECSSSEVSSATADDIESMADCVRSRASELPPCFEQCVALKSANAGAAPVNPGNNGGNNGGGRGGRQCKRQGMQQCLDRFGCPKPDRSFHGIMKACKRENN